jgi:hypothetical protein
LVVAMVLSGVVRRRAIVDFLLSIVRLVVRALMVIVQRMWVPAVVPRVLPVHRVPAVRNMDTVEQQQIFVELVAKEVTVIVGLCLLPFHQLLKHRLGLRLGYRQRHQLVNQPELQPKPQRENPLLRNNLFNAQKQFSQSICFPFGIFLLCFLYFRIKCCFRFFFSVNRL